MSREMRLDEQNYQSKKPRNDKSAVTRNMNNSFKRSATNSSAIDRGSCQSRSKRRGKVTDYDKASPISVVDRLQ